MSVTDEDLVARLNERVSHRRGIRVRAGGVLDETLEGRPPGTAYVLLEVRTVRDSEIAEALFSHLGGRSSLAWAHGWRSLPAEDRAAGWILAIELFVDAAVLDDDEP